MTTEKTSSTVASNRQARYNYFIEEQVEAGIVLTGTEVKSLRGGRCSINEAFAVEQNEEIFLVNADIPPYRHAAPRYNHAPKRARKLLLGKKQIGRLLGAIRRQGMTLVPLEIYFNSAGLAKCRLGLAKGKKAPDKRETIKKREWNLRQRRILKG